MDHIVTPHSGTKVKVTGNCYVTGEEYSVVVEKADLFDYIYNGKFAQDAFPYLSAEDREFLISGTSPEGWKLLFGERED